MAVRAGEAQSLFPGSLSTMLGFVKDFSLQRKLISSSVVYSGFSKYCREPERPSRFIK